MDGPRLCALADGHQTKESHGEVKEITRMLHGIKREMEEARFDEFRPRPIGGKAERNIIVEARFDPQAIDKSSISEFLISNFLTASETSSPPRMGAL